MNLPRSPWNRFFIAITAGVLWALSFPRAGIAGFAWAVPGLLLAATACLPARQAFRIAYVAALTHYLISLSWLRFIPFPAGAFAGWFCLSMFLALIPAVWTVACWHVARNLGLESNQPRSHEIPNRTPRKRPHAYPGVPLGGLDPAPAFVREMQAWGVLADRLAATPWLRLNAWFLLSAAAWVATEMLVSRVFGGFPWNLLGASQYRMTPLIQIASATGVYGVSFLVTWFSVSLATAVLFLARTPERPALWRRSLVFPALMVVATAAGGFFGIITDPAQPRRLTIALVQPNIPQTLIFDPDQSQNRFETLLQLTEQALATRPDLVIWPEASLPGGLGPEDFERLASRVRQAGVWMIFGADDAETEPGLTPDSEPAVMAYNGAFLLNPAGKVAAVYHKRRLVMFGEYVPFGRWFPVLQRLAPIGDGFVAGKQPVPFQMDSLDASTSPLVCFEDNFPLEARDHAAQGIDFLVNLTNNAWFGESSAQWQHAANAVFRAIETGLPLVRACNNGLSCWIDARGRLHSGRIAEGKSIYAAGFEVFSLPFGVPRPTLYRQLGDAFGWSCCLATIAFLRPDRLRFRFRCQAP